MRHSADYVFSDSDLQRCPYEFHRMLREETPVYREPRTDCYQVSEQFELLTDESSLEYDPMCLWRGLRRLPFRLRRRVVR